MGKKDCWDEEAGGWNLDCLYRHLVEKDKVLDHVDEDAFDNILGVAYNDRILGGPGPFIIRLGGHGHFAVEKYRLRQRILEWFWAGIDIPDSEVI